MALLSDYLSAMHEDVSREVRDEIFNLANMIVAEGYSYADHMFMSELLEQWLRVIGVTVIVSEGKQESVRFAKNECPSFAFVAEDDLLFCHPCSWKNVEVDALTVKFLKVKSQSYLLRYNCFQASLDLLNWKMLAELLQNKQAGISFSKKSNVKIALTREFVAESRMLASL